MRKLLLISTFLGIISVGCHTAKQTQHIVKDTVITQSPAATLKPVDSIATIKEQLANTLNTPLNFTTFYGRAKANFSSPQASGNATVYIKMQKDSIIWISITGPLNIEGARVLITPDSVKIMNKLESTLQLSSIAHLQQLTKLPLTFNDFQNLILGRPAIIGNNVDYQFKKDSITITSAGDLLTYVYSFTKNNLQLGQSNFQPVNNTTVKSANIFYNDYRQVDNINFSASRDISVSGEAPITLQLNFKEYNFNQPQTFLFTVSKNYTIKYE
ncbi:MAG: DUF4292 domain-containing protein [Parafilimonas sp.]|nr:DUF4292 domain-containing protein [Parafilimonas sp.]